MSFAQPEPSVAKATRELRPEPDAETSYSDFVSREWARRWPAEHLWKLSKPPG